MFVWLCGRVVVFNCMYVCIADDMCAVPFVRVTRVTLARPVRECYVCVYIYIYIYIYSERERDIIIIISYDINMLYMM